MRLNLVSDEQRDADRRRDLATVAALMQRFRRALALGFSPDDVEARPVDGTEARHG